MAYLIHSFLQNPGPYCQKVWLTLEEMKIPYKIEKVNMRVSADEDERGMLRSYFVLIFIYVFSSSVTEKSQRRS